MAISSLINPSGKPSVQDNLWHIATSDNSGQVDFKYVFDVYNGNTQLIRAKVFPSPDNGKGYFDAGPIVRNEINYQWFNPDGQFFSYSPDLDGEIGQVYNVRVGEDFSGLTTLNLASGFVSGYNFVPPVFKRRMFDFTAKNNKSLTDRFLSMDSNFGEDLYFPLHSSLVTKLSVTRYIGASASTSSVYTFTPSYQQLNIGPDAVNVLLDDIAMFLINSSTTRYVITIDMGSGGKYDITVNMECNGKFTPIPLHFMNAYGMYETARFQLVNRLSKEIERKTFEKRDYNFGSSSVDYFTTHGSNNKYIESKINYGSKINWNYKLTMYPPTDSDYEWLAQLIDSPIIYAEIDSEYYPVTIKETNYEYSKHDFNGLRPLELNIEMNQKRYGYKR